MRLQVLLEAHDTATAEGTTLVMVADGPATRRPMTLTGIEDTIATYPTRVTAQHAINA